jgi:predicted nucleotidyltransferase
MEIEIPVKYRKDIEIATDLLKSEGCQSIYLFGSLVTGKTHDDSDIDIGIKGLPEGKFFEACSKVYFAMDNEIDIVDFDSNDDFYCASGAFYLCLQYEKGDSFLWGLIPRPLGRLKLRVRGICSPA